MTKYREIELQLLEAKVRELAAIGMGSDAARAEAARRVDDVVKAAKSRGRYGVGPLGECMRNDPDYASYFAWAQTYYGVRPQDIHAWWDLDEVIRCMAELDNGQDHLVVYMNARRMGMSEDAATAKQWELFPYYDFDFGRQSSDKDRAPRLPAELLPRVAPYVEKYTRVGASVAADQGFATFNEWVYGALSQEAE
jgi:hypothetical protein